MDATNWISLTAILVAPISVLAGAWMNSALTRRSKVEETERAALDAMLRALGEMKALLVDSTPSLVLNNELIEYENPKDAVAGLYSRWLKAREPFVLLAVTHPVEEVRNRAFAVQANAEWLLRILHGITEGKADPFHPDRAQKAFRTAWASANELGRLLSPFRAEKYRPDEQQNGVEGRSWEDYIARPDGNDK